MPRRQPSLPTWHDELVRWIRGVLAVALALGLVTGCGREPGPGAQQTGSKTQATTQAGRGATRAVFGPGPRRIIVISLDTLRADQLSCYGCPRRTSAFLDSLAATGIRFSHASAPANWTLPSHASFFSATYLTHHGVLRPSQRLSPLSPCPVEALHDAGFRTAAFTGGGYVLPVYGFGRGFEVYESFRQLDARWPDILAKAEAWLSEHRQEDFFLFLHTYEIHEPYNVPDEYIRRLCPHPRTAVKGDHGELRVINKRGATPDEIADLLCRYDAGILYTDELLGRWYARIGAMGLHDNLLMIVTSDHGQQFWEHGYHGHGNNYLGPEVTDIPLIVHLPDAAAEGRRGEVLDEPVSFLDVLPTVLDATGVSTHWVMDGVSRLPELLGDTIASADAATRRLRTAVVDGHPEPLTICEGVQFMAVGAGRYRAVIPRPTTQGKLLRQRPALYDLQLDPTMHTALPLRGAVADSLRASFARLMSRSRSETAPADVQLDEQAREQLRALGYAN